VELHLIFDVPFILLPLTRDLRNRNRLRQDLEKMKIIVRKCSKFGQKMRHVPKCGMKMLVLVYKHLGRRKTLFLDTNWTADDKLSSIKQNVILLIKQFRQRNIKHTRKIVCLLVELVRIFVKNGKKNDFLQISTELCKNAKI